MFISWMLIMPRFKKSLIVEQFQGNYLKHQTFLIPQTPTGSTFAARQPLRMSRRSWAAVTDFKTRVLRLKPEVQILGSSKSIRHTKVEILRLKSCFLRKKETKLNANLWKTFSTEVFCRNGFTLFCSMICIWRANSVPDPILLTFCKLINTTILVVVVNKFVMFESLRWKTAFLWDNKGNRKWKKKQQKTRRFLL